MLKQFKNIIESVYYSYVFEYISLILFLLVFLFLYLQNYRSYIFLSLAPTFGLVLFIIFRKTFYNYNLMRTINIHSCSYNLYSKVLLISFFLFYSFSLLTILNGFYTKTIWYYVFISICAGIIAVEILSLDSRDMWKSNLFMSLLLFLNLTLINQILYPLQIGNPDNFYHMGIITSIIEQGYIPLGFTYTHFPMHHLLAGLTTIATNISLSVVYHCLGTVVMASGVLFAFLIGRKFVNTSFGLLAALLFSCSDYLIYWGGHPVQLTYMLPLILLIFAVILYNFKKRDTKFIILFLLLCINLVFLHHYSAIIMLFAMISILFVEFTYKVQYKEYNLKSSGLFQLYLLILFTHWMFYSGLFNNFINIINVYIKSFTNDASSSVVSQTYYDGLPIETIVINEIGSFFLLCLSVVGLFYFIRKRSHFGDIISTIFIILILLIGIGTIIDVYYLLPNRIYAFMQELTMIFLASATIIWILKNSSKRYVKYGIVLIIVVLQFFSASSTIAGFETSPFVGDQPYWKFYETQQEKNSLLWINENLGTSNQNNPVYLNPGFRSPSTSTDLPTDRYTIKEKNNKILVDLKSINRSSYFSFSKFDVDIGFRHGRAMGKYHMGSGNKVKMNPTAKQILNNNPSVLQVYNNEMISIHYKK